MSMVANNYLTTYDNLSQPEIVGMLTGGFTGTLRSWWEKHLTSDSRDSIIHAIQGMKREILFSILLLEWGLPME